MSETFAERRSALFFHVPCMDASAGSYGGVRMETIGSPLLWTAFAVVVVLALLVDLVLMRHGGPHKVTFKEATWWSLGLSLIHI